MELYWAYFACLILCIHVNLSSEQTGLPSSPCPNLFQYQHDGYEWYGLVQIPNLDLGPTRKLEVNLSLASQLPSQFVGALELLGSSEAAIQEIQSNQPVRYIIHFPLQSPLPKLTQISVNGHILCTGPPETGPYITQIPLEHTLFTEVAAERSLPASGISNNITSQYSFDVYNNPEYRYSLPQAQPQQSNNASQSESEICGKQHARFLFTHMVRPDTIIRGSWPWLVAIYINKAIGSFFNCGGSLVSSKVVVTAASCLRTTERQYTPNEIVLFLGRYNILNWTENGYKAVQVKQIVIHPDYMSKDTSYDADIAVVIMNERIGFTEYILPICLWEGADDINEVEGMLGTVLGWGRDSTGNIVSPEPKKISMPIVSQAVCLRSSDTYRYITSKRTFCAGRRGGTEPCNGSGSGMALIRHKKWMLRGITSVSVGDPVVNSCNLGEYVVFTDAAKFVDWIKGYMG